MNDKLRTHEQPPGPAPEDNTDDAAAMAEITQRADTIASAAACIVEAALSLDSKKFLEVNQQQNAQ